MKKRMANIELLRIVSMMMVVMLHYLGKGGLLPETTGAMTVNGYVAWGMESLCIVSAGISSAEVEEVPCIIISF